MLLNIWENTEVNTSVVLQWTTTEQCAMPVWILVAMKLLQCAQSEGSYNILSAISWKKIISKKILFNGTFCLISSGFSICFRHFIFTMVKSENLFPKLISSSFLPLEKSKLQQKSSMYFPFTFILECQDSKMQEEIETKPGIREHKYFKENGFHFD